MGYACAAVFTQDMKTKGELLADAIQQAGVDKAAFGRALGYANAYGTIQAYINGSKKIGDRVAKKLAAELKLPADYFLDEKYTEERLDRVTEAYEGFLRTPVGSSASEEELAAIKRLLPALRAPTSEWLVSMVLHLRGQSPMPVFQRHEVAALSNTSARQRTKNSRAK